MNYYNEFDSFVAQWLRNLIEDGLIAPGVVDTRSIVDVQPDDLKGFKQVHLFAGIGGWSYALRLVGWSDDEPVWTGSCPCQPFSNAGSRKGTKDERHLWPEMQRLLAECRPAVCFGEQVASKDGREWLAGVRVDLEVLGYAVGAADLCSVGEGAPHIRQRLHWVADRNGGDPRSERLQRGGQHRQQQEDSRISSGLGLSSRLRLERPSERDTRNALSSAWAASVAISCSDGKFRRVACNSAAEIEPTLFPLAVGVPNRMGAVRGAGNAINPWLAKSFIEAYAAI